MKNTILLLMSLLVLTASCKDKEEEPDTNKTTRTPKLDLEFAYLYNFGVTAYANQDTINADSIAYFDNFAVIITETNLSTSTPLEFEDLKFSFELTSNSDQESLVGGDNAAQFGLSLVEFGSVREISGEYYLPVKINATAVPGNDTLEISSVADIINMNYSSQHSSQTGSKSAIIVP